MSASLEQDGFTLLELVIALGLFASGLLGLTILTSGLVTHNMIARHHAAAIQLAQNKFEMLRQKAYAEIVDSMEPEENASGDSGGGIFSREVTVEENDDPTYKLVTVTVSWCLNGEHQVALSSIMAAP